MASLTNAEKLCSEINVLLFDVCHFLTSAMRLKELSPRVKTQAQNLVSRSQEKMEAISEMQKEVLRIEVETSDAKEDEFPHQHMTPWDLPRCSTKYGPLVTNERTYLIGPKKTVFVGLVDCYLLFYKINKKNERPSDWINVMDYTARALENRKDFAFEITAPGKQRFEFMARTSKDVDQWVVAIKYKKQPVMISNIEKTILDSDLQEYWEPKPSQNNYFTGIEQHNSNSNNDNIEPIYYNNSIIESNIANDSEEVLHVYEEIPLLPERTTTNNFHLKNKKLLGLSHTFEDNNNTSNFVSYNDQSFPKESAPIQSTSAVVIQEINKPTETTGNQYKDTISVTNTQSSTSSSSLNSSRDELPVQVLPKQIPVNDNETFSNQTKTKPKVPAKSLKLYSSQKPDNIQIIEEPKTFQEIRQNMEIWSLEKKNQI